MSKLSPRYVPKELPHREGQVKDLFDFFSDSVEDPSRAILKVYQIVGDVGSGKTVTTLKFSQLLEQESRRRKIDFKHVYVNPKQHGTSRLILFRHIVQQVEPDVFSASYSAEELMLELMKHLSRKGKYLIVTFDEIDYFLKHSKDPVIYNLTRLNEVLPGGGCNVLGVIFTARSAKYQEDLDKAELSTLGRFYAKFEPYDSKQLFDILERRAYEAFRQGAVGDEVLKFIADVTAAPSVNGDVRYALDLLLYAGRLAENQGSDRVKLEHVRYVLSVTSPSLTEEDIMYITDEEKVVLLCIARALRSRREPYLTFDEIVESYRDVSKEYKSKELDLRDMVKYVQDLGDRGIVDVKGLTQIGITKVPTEVLDKFLERLIQRLRGEGDETP